MSIEGDFFTNFEEEKGIQLPEFIKNTLKFCGFSNILSISKLEKTDLDAVEDIAKNTIPKIFKGELDKYLGDFKDIPKDFFFLPGYKKTIYSLKEFASQELEKTRERKIKENKLRKKRKRTNSKSSSKSGSDTATEKEIVDDSVSDLERKQNEAKNVRSNNNKNESNNDSVIDNIKRRLETWLQKFIKNLNLSDEKENILLRKVEKGTIITNSVEGDKCTSLLITCCYCKKNVRIFKASGGTFLLSNYHKHFSTHRAMLKKVKDNETESFSILKYMYNSRKDSNLENSLDSASSSSFQGPPDNEDCIVMSMDTPLTEVISNDCFIGSPEKSLNLDNTENVTMSDVHTSLLSCDGVPYDNTLNETNNHQNFSQSRVIMNEDSNTCLNACNIVKSSNKWKNENYSRRQRNIRKLENSSLGSLPITHFFPIIQTVENVIISEMTKCETKSLAENIPRIALNNEFFGKQFQIDKYNVTPFLKTLFESSMSQSKLRGKRHNEGIKNFATYLYLIGGKMLYEVLTSNTQTALPSLKTVKRVIEKEQVIEEGCFRFKELREFCIKRNLPLDVWLSEDQTAINNKIEYSPKNNCAVGFTPHLDENGLPRINSFAVESLGCLENYFKNEVKSNYINIIVAQPLDDKAPSFCVCVYGTNNRFSSSDVEKRWRKMLEMAEAEGIRVLGFSTDGDTRMLKTMKNNINLPTNTKNWFQAEISLYDPLYFQDVVHIGTKLKTVFLKEGVVLPIGNYFASPVHLEYLIENHSKDKHLLTKAILAPMDKMNFESVEKITNPKVISALLQFVSGAKGTAVYLIICRYILDSFLEKNMSPSKRILQIWVAVFFLRIWRSSLHNSREYSISENFISLNCYTCIEINAHSLIRFTQRCRERNEPHQFLPWYLSSQPCESTFRKLRSMTSTFSTVVNFSVLDVLRRLNRINLLNEIVCDTGKFIISYSLLNQYFLSFQKIFLSHVKKIGD